MHCSGERGYHCEVMASCGNSSGLSCITKCTIFSSGGVGLGRRGNFPLSDDLMSTLLCSLLREANIRRSACIYRTF